MATRARVRTHQRRTRNGRTTTVHQHSRHGRPQQAIVSPTHAARLAGKAWRTWRKTGRNGKRRRGTAILIGSLAVGELAAWGTLRGVGLIAFTAGVLAIGVGSLAFSASGGKT